MRDRAYTGSCMADHLVIAVCTQWASGSRYRLTISAPRADWPLSDLCELARETADSAGLVSERMQSMTITLTWPSEGHGDGPADVSAAASAHART